MENFIKLDYQLLQRVDINLEEKVLVSYLQGWQSSNKVCFETQEEISTKLGISIRTLKRTIQSLKEKRIIFTSNDRKYLIPFNNRKALVLVDTNNPYPTPLEETTSTKKITSNEVKSSEVIHNTTSTMKCSENEGKLGKIERVVPTQTEEDEIDIILQRSMNKITKTNSSVSENELELLIKGSSDVIPPTTYSEYKIGGFVVPTQYINNGLYKFLTKGNDGNEMRGLVSKLKRNNNQTGFEIDLRDMYLTHSQKVYEIQKQGI